tara:strand:+ start:623 stop:1285 length:663 start_codon:yes stop_codon:yes gene_type:complete
MNIIFDLDGTLIDSAPDIQSVASTVLEKLGKDGLTLDETRSFIGEGSAVFVRRMMNVRGINETLHTHTAVHEDFVAEYEFSVDKAVFYPDVIATLTALKADNHKLGLCTNKPELPARAVIRHMGIESFFDAVMAAGMLNSRKPDPAMLLKTIEDLGGGPTLYVGDSEVDAETASRAEVRLALFSEGYRKTPVNEIQHDWVFSEFASLPAIVAKAMLIEPR